VTQHVRDKAASNGEDFATFRLTLQLPYSELLTLGCDTVYLAETCHISEEPTAFIFSLKNVRQ
jgi:hypothetical protein